MAESSRNYPRTVPKDSKKWQICRSSETLEMRHLNPEQSTTGETLASTMDFERVEDNSPQQQQHNQQIFWHHNVLMDQVLASVAHQDKSRWIWRVEQSSL